MNSPCLTCRRVSHPRQCENKNCKPWRSWYTQKWDAMRRVARQKMDTAAPSPEGTVIGGKYYTLPHRVHAYLNTDPCAGCLCPKDLCAIPCHIKQRWQAAREDVLL